jgi:hypothetical protein
MPGCADIRTAVAAERAKHSRHKVVVRGLVRQVVDLEDCAVPAIRVAAVDPELAVAQAALVRARHRLVVEQQVRDRPGHAPMIPPSGPGRKPLDVVSSPEDDAIEGSRPRMRPCRSHIVRRQRTRLFAMRPQL